MCPFVSLCTRRTNQRATVTLVRLSEPDGRLHKLQPVKTARRR